MASTRTQLLALTNLLLLDNVIEEITPQDLRQILLEMQISLFSLMDDGEKENVGVAAGLIADLKGAVAADGNTLYKLRELIRGLSSGAQEGRSVVAAPSDGIIVPSYSGKIIRISVAGISRSLSFPDPATNPTFWATIRRYDTNTLLNCSFTCGGTGVFEEGDGVNLQSKSNITIQSDGTNYITVAL
jgi:hypothetical protein